jgi:DNA-binding NarL/FixJ family response regulator
MEISVLLFEDNDLLRESITSLLRLNDKIRSVVAYDNVRDVRNIVRSTAADVILMDIEMPGATGIEALEVIRKEKITAPVIMLTVFDDNQSVLDAIKGGASGYLLKKDISTKLVDAIVEVLNGGAPMSPTVARMVVASMQKSTVDPYNLTPREKDILTSLSKGNSFKMIAAEFDISIDTVRTHIKKIYEKLHVHSQTEAVSKAISEKLV